MRNRTAAFEISSLPPAEVATFISTLLQEQNVCATVGTLKRIDAHWRAWKIFTEVHRCEVLPMRQPAMQQFLLERIVAGVSASGLRAYLKSFSTIHAAANLEVAWSDELCQSAISGARKVREAEEQVRALREKAEQTEAASPNGPPSSAPKRRTKSKRKGMFERLIVKPREFPEDDEPTVLACDSPNPPDPADFAWVPEDIQAKYLDEEALWIGPQSEREHLRELVTELSRQAFLESGADAKQMLNFAASAYFRRTRLNEEIAIDVICGGIFAFGSLSAFARQADIELKDLKGAFCHIGSVPTPLVVLKSIQALRTALTQERLAVLRRKPRKSKG